MKTVSQQRATEGALQTGGIFALITAVIELVRHFFPEWPWAQIMPVLGSVIAFYTGGKVSEAIHKWRAPNAGD